MCVIRKHTYKIQLLLDRQIGFHYYEQVSGPTEVIVGTDETPGQAQFVVRVNQNKVPSSLVRLPSRILPATGSGMTGCFAFYPGRSSCSTTFSSFLLMRRFSLLWPS
jgi:hypothetical protein